MRGQHRGGRGAGLPERGPGDGERGGVGGEQPDGVERLRQREHPLARDRAAARGLSPATPHSAAGVRTLAPVSVPTASARCPAATAAADPDEEPPVIRVGSCGCGPARWRRRHRWGRRRTRGCAACRRRPPRPPAASSPRARPPSRGRRRPAAANRSGWAATGHVDQVLDPHRDAVQRAEPAPRRGQRGQLGGALAARSASRVTTHPVVSASSRTARRRRARTATGRPSQGPQQIGERQHALSVPSLPDSDNR